MARLRVAEAAERGEPLGINPAQLRQPFPLIDGALIGSRCPAGTSSVGGLGRLLPQAKNTPPRRRLFT